MRLSFLIACIFFSFSLFGQIDTGHVDTVICQKNTMQYLLKYPNKIDQNSHQPMLIFLHGAGERGDDLSIVNVHGPLKKENQHFVEDYYVLTPQCPRGVYWNTEMLYLLIEKIISEYNIDKTRIYLTGLSMGGWGTWRLSIDHSELFAAISPLCAPVDDYMLTNIHKIKNIPVWVFHGKKDSVFPVDVTKKLVKTLEKIEANPILTIYPEAGHDVWSDTYSSPEFYSWLFSHKKQ